jgi:hypothetical protein
MKHLYPATLALLISPGLSAQIQITSADMPVIGDELTRYSDTIPTYGPGGSGPDQSWDFSAAAQGSEQVSSIVDPATTPSADQFGSSNLAMTTDGLNYSYMTNTANAMTVDGFAGDPLGDGTLMLDAPFDPTLTLHQFPRQYTTAFNDDFGFDVTVDGSGFGVYQARIREVATVSDTTDGYGTITTPVGTYDCLRSRTVTIRTDSIWAQLLQILPFTLVQSTVDTTVTYVWHAVETKLPVAEMTVDSVGNAIDFTWSAIAPNSTGVAGTNAPLEGFTLFPQPATDRVQLMSVAPWLSVTVTDMDGRAVISNERVARGGTLDIGALPSGVFMVNAINPEGGRSAQRLVHVSSR